MKLLYRWKKSHKQHNPYKLILSYSVPLSSARNEHFPFFSGAQADMKQSHRKKKNPVVTKILDIDKFCLFRDEILFGSAARKKK